MPSHELEVITLPIITSEPISDIKTVRVLYSLLTDYESPDRLFHLEILNTDFLAKVWGYYLQSLQRLSTKVCKYFRPFESLQRLSF